MPVWDFITMPKKIIVHHIKMLMHVSDIIIYYCADSVMIFHSTVVQ